VAAPPLQLAHTGLFGAWVCMRTVYRVTDPAVAAVAEVVRAAAPPGATRGAAPAAIMAAVARPGRAVARLLTVDSPGALTSPFPSRPPRGQLVLTLRSSCESNELSTPGRLVGSLKIANRAY